MYVSAFLAGVEVKRFHRLRVAGRPNSVKSHMAGVALRWAFCKELHTNFNLSICTVMLWCFSVLARAVWEFSIGLYRVSNTRPIGRS